MAYMYAVLVSILESGIFLGIIIIGQTANCTPARKIIGFTSLFFLSSVNFFGICFVKCNKCITFVT